MTFQKYLYNKILSAVGKENEESLKIISKKTDFLVAPASAKHHLAFEGGLAIHTLNVINNVNKLYQDNDNISLNDALKCALLHDLCKTGYYVELEDGGYTFLPEIKGHGDRSVKLALDLGIELSDCEKALIQFHMGPFAPMGTLSHIDEIEQLNVAKTRLNVIKEYQNTYSQAVKLYPQILTIYNADHSASVAEEKITQKDILEEYKKSNKNK